MRCFSLLQFGLKVRRSGSDRQRRTTDRLFGKSTQIKRQGAYTGCAKAGRT